MVPCRTQRSKFIVAQLDSTGTRSEWSPLASHLKNASVHWLRVWWTTTGTSGNSAGNRLQREIDWWCSRLPSRSLRRVLLAVAPPSQAQKASESGAATAVTSTQGLGVEWGYAAGCQSLANAASCLIGTKLEWVHINELQMGHTWLYT